MNMYYPDGMHVKDELCM